MTTASTQAGELVARLWQNFPQELLARPQWLLAGRDSKGLPKMPMGLDYGGMPTPGDVADPGTWLSFEDAAQAAGEFGMGLGYVLSADDPYTCVDLDVKNQTNEPDPTKWTSAEALAAMHMLVEDLESYTELSLRQQGVHVWCRGKIGEGIKRSGVELYSQGRFIVCTGMVVHRLPVADRQDELSQIAETMRASQQALAAVTLDTVHELELEDEALLARAAGAENGAKFRELWEGKWQGNGYPSQSEADLSLMSMFTFYSRNDEQCRRLFRRSGLGGREKALKNDKYLNRTLRLIRGRQKKEEDMQAQVADMTTRMLEGLRNGARQGPAPGPGAAPLPPGAPPLPAGPEQPPAPPVPPSNGLDWPPGAAGALAQFIYDSAPRPVREVAIVAALGWLAGVCGKAWTIPGSGLNVYIILVARSAIGKEAMHSGIGALVARVREGVPGTDNFVDFNDFASGPALAKVCAQKSSFVNVAGEFGHKLRRMAQSDTSGGESTMRQLRTVMTNLYQKSGPASIVGGITYSSKDNNVASVSGVAFSMIGETTPDTLYESLTEGMMADGFLSRFTIVEYMGMRPPANPYPVRQPSNELTHLCQQLCLQAITLINNHQRCPVGRTAEAAAIMDGFDLECDGNINATYDEATRQMWNRAHLKMCRLAALLAVADNHATPVITREHAEWALGLIRRDIATMSRKITDGDVGTTDASRERKLMSVIREYLTQPVPASYGVPATMPRDGIVPRKYLQIRVRQLSAFNQHRLGATAALDSSIRSLCDSGYLMEVDRAKVTEAYTFQGKCFRVVQLG